MYAWTGGSKARMLRALHGGTSNQDGIVRRKNPARRPANAQLECHNVVPLQSLPPPVRPARPVTEPDRSTQMPFQCKKGDSGGFMLNHPIRSGGRDVVSLVQPAVASPAVITTSFENHLWHACDTDNLASLFSRSA